VYLFLYTNSQLTFSDNPQLGAVKAPEPKKFTLPAKTETPAEDSDDEESGDDNDAELSSASDNEEEASDEAPEPTSERSKKRKRKAAEEDLEDVYMRKLHMEDEPKPSKKSKAEKKDGEEAEGSGAESDSDEEDEEEKKKDSAFPIKHESLINPVDVELDKSARTVFLGNVPSNAISSKSDYKTLKAHFGTVGKVHSIRFRSIAFSEQIPRKAAFANHKLHEKQKTVNAYVVYTTLEGARAALKLNGQICLDRHIRVDSVAHPGKHEPKRCIFVGNLDFEAQEESLWRHFGKCGKIEYVRIIRDSKTNVGKGFAYVQFEDAMVVDQALLLDGKKMVEGKKTEGDRKLRVSRAKAIKRNAKGKPEVQQRRAPSKKPQSTYVPKADPKQQATLGRATKLLGKAGATQLKKQATVIEGLRASATTPSGIKKGGSGKKSGGKTRARQTKRSTAWKKKE
jgi:nucleolar protein 12